jgi:hypothetical protein
MPLPIQKSIANNYVIADLVKYKYKGREKVTLLLPKVYQQQLHASLLFLHPNKTEPKPAESTSVNM